MVYLVALSSADITSIFNAQKVVFGLYYINELISHTLIPFLRIDFTCETYSGRPGKLVELASRIRSI
jgi:hypothetical protein